MQNLLKIATALANLALLAVTAWQTKKRNDEINEIRKDPAAEFEREFGGVRHDEASLPSDTTGADIDNQK